jgi:hypothetical protein
MESEALRADDLARPGHKEMEELEFPRAQLQVVTAARHPHGCRVELDVPDRERT